MSASRRFRIAAIPADGVGREVVAAVASNLHADILSDLGSALAGSLGLG